jgi:FkbM family methyltransferase
MILSKVLKLLRAKTLRVKRSREYPFTFYNEDFSIYFEINNPIEEFRLAQWGGEKDYVIDLVKNLKKDDVFYDVGSSVGLISIISASVLKDGKVISFEPDPENLKRLQRNYSINNLKNCITVPIAVGDKKSKLQLFTQGSNGYSPSLKKVNGIEKYIEVEVDSIDNLLENKKIPFPNVIKIDIEGAELMALKGMENLLLSAKKPRLIFLEIHPKFLPSFNCSTDEVYEYLGRFNYSMAEKIQREDQILCKLVSI